MLRHPIRHPMMRHGRRCVEYVSVGFVGDVVAAGGGGQPTLLLWVIGATAISLSSGCSAPLLVSGARGCSMWISIVLDFVMPWRETRTTIAASSAAAATDPTAMPLIAAGDIAVSGLLGAEGEEEGVGAHTAV